VVILSIEDFKFNDYKKSCIEQNQIKSNILNYVILRLDYSGLLSTEAFIKNLQVYLKEEGYILEEGRLSDKDIEVLDENYIFRGYINKDLVYRFSKNDKSNYIIVSRFFTYIYMDYKSKQKLSKQIEILTELANIINQDDFVQIQQVSLKKNNSVIIKSMSNILKCFDVRIFNDVPFEVNRIGGKMQAELLSNNFESKFTWGDILFKTERSISKGETMNKNKVEECYEVMFEIKGVKKFNQLDRIYDENINNEEKWLNIQPTVEKINSGIFEIFKLYITKSFLEDMISINYSKILKGLNENEQI